MLGVKKVFKKQVQRVQVQCVQVRILSVCTLIDDKNKPVSAQEIGIV